MSTVTENSEDHSSGQLTDYKIFNFDGEPKLIQVDYDRFINHKRNLYTTDWEYVEGMIKYSTDPDHIIEKPKALSEMLELAKKLSVGIPHVRTDFYCIDDKIYFGELTFHHGSGFEDFHPESLGLQIGEWLKLPNGGIALRVDGYFFWMHNDFDAKERLTSTLLDYKLMCYNGKVQNSFVCTDRFSSSGLKVTFYDRDWTKMPFERHYPADSRDIPKPTRYNEMIDLAEKLSTGIPFVRVDFYECDQKIYFGEMTFYPGSGMEEFSPEEWDEKLGRLIELPETVGGVLPKG